MMYWNDTLIVFREKVEKVKSYPDLEHHRSRKYSTPAVFDGIVYMTFL